MDPCPKISHQLLSGIHLSWILCCIFQLKEMTNLRNWWMRDICQRFGGFDNFFNSADFSRFQIWFIKHGTASQETTAPGGKYSNHVESGHRHAKWRYRCLSGVLPQVHRWSTKRTDEDFLVIGVLRQKSLPEWWDKWWVDSQKLYIGMYTLNSGIPYKKPWYFKWWLLLRWYLWS